MKSTTSPNTVSTPARAGFSFGETARSAPPPPPSRQYLVNRMPQVFRFSTSKNESLFLQRKNPRKISWTVPYRRLHKKGITEEIAKKRSRKTVKHQRGIVGADMASILAKRNQSTQIRTAQRSAAIQKAKSEKKEKEAKKPKVQPHCSPHHTACIESICGGLSASGRGGAENLKASGEGWKGWPLVDGSGMLDSYVLLICTHTHHAKHIHPYKRRPFITSLGKFGEY